MRRIVSLIQRSPAVAHADPALEANAYAVAEDVDLTVVLRGAGIEHALAAAEPPRATLAGVALAGPAQAQDLRGLVESGIPVLASAADVTAAGLRDADLIPGVRVVGDEDITETLRVADGVVSW